MDAWKEKLIMYNHIIATRTTFERKGKAMPYTAINGYMFSMLNKAGEVGFVLPKESRKALTEKYNTTVFKSYGAVIREYVLIPDKLLNNLALLGPLLLKSYEYTQSLPPK